MRDSSASGAIYKGFRFATTASGAHHLYATDFHNNKIDVFDGTFTKIVVPGEFKDAQIPAGFVPFGIQAIGSKIFVTYAKQNEEAEDDMAGAAWASSTCSTSTAISCSALGRTACSTRRGALSRRRAISARSAMTFWSAISATA